MTQLILVWLAAAIGQVPGDAIDATAQMPPGPLVVGQEYQIELTWRVRDGYSASDSGIAQAILQIDPPAAAALTGKVLTDHKALARNEFLCAPFERLLKSSRESIGFTVAGTPDAGEWFALNLVAYVSTAGGNDARLVRKRLLLPLVSGAKAGPGSPQMSDWGDGRFLQNGEFAEPFVVQRADGSSLSLDDYRGEKNTVVTTYRAHWWPFCVKQLGQLQEMYAEFEKRDTVVVAIAQEDTTLQKHGRILAAFKPAPKFEIAADLNGAKTQRYHPTSTYLIDKAGIVRQVFPMLIHHRASWRAVLNEIDALSGPDAAKGSPG